MAGSPGPVLLGELALSPSNCNNQATGEAGLPCHIILIAAGDWQPHSAFLTQERQKSAENQPWWLINGAVNPNIPTW